MAVPSWPDGVPFKCLRNGRQPYKAMLDPTETEFEGGNVRRRSRPGDDVGTLGQTIRMTSEQAEALQSWIATTLGGGNARFRLQVWLISEYVERVCQFVKGSPTYGDAGAGVVDVVMQLRVYN